MLDVCKRWWKQYRHRFLPWIMLNYIRRAPRYTSTNHRLRASPSDTDIVTSLQHLFAFLDIADQHPSVSTQMFSEVTVSPDTAPVELRDRSTAAALRYRRNLEVMRQCFGFTVERRPSTLKHGGTGVIVTSGTVPAATVTSLYPGVIYQIGEPVFLQSLGNTFVLRCIDGLYIDGNDRNISAAIYRSATTMFSQAHTKWKSCSRRDSAVYGLQYDTSWLTQFPVNPLAVGQYVNNCTHDHPANVAYQEVDLPAEFVRKFHCYIPNIYFGSPPEFHAARLVRTVALMSLRDIDCGEELFSTYFTIDTS